MASIHGPTSHSFFSQRLRLHYVDWGNPGAPPMLLLHGGCDHCRSWDWVAEAFRGDYHVMAPDLRGHGDSQWSIGGTYPLTSYIYDVAQLLHQTKAPPVTVISHSLGAVVALYYAGIYPHSVSRLIAIEGLAPPPQMRKEAQRPIEARLRSWVDDLRALSGRMPRRYVSIEEAFHRMQQENPNLSPEQAHHLTVHGINQNEDGTYSWKFDNYVRPAPPLALRGKDTVRLWGRIACPTLLVRGSESWATDPNQDGRIAHFHHAEAVSIEGAGHWVHHDRLDAFVARVREFLSRPRRDEYGGES